MRDRSRPAVDAIAVHSLGAVAVLVGTFMPWIRSGTRRRSSYDILDVAERLGFSPHGALGWAVRCWPLVPLLVVASVAAHLVGLRRTAGVATVAAVAYVAVVAIAVRRAPTSALIGIEAGTWVCLTGAAILFVAAVLIATRPGAPARPSTRSVDPS